jgi:hydrogenase maturation protease
MPNPNANDSKVNLLVIGYGNELRSDDGVGPKVVSALEQLNLPGVRTMVCQQLMPELAEPVSLAQRVIFVDAAVDAASGIQLRELKPSESSQMIAHSADPRTLLALARDVFGHCPAAWWLTIPIEKLDFGSDLSPIARRGFQLALEKIQSLAKSS